MSARKPICDFCNGTPVRWAYPTRDFTTPTRDGEGEWGSHGSWAACMHCAALIERTDRDGLAKRSAKKFARLHGTTTKQELRPVRTLHDKFWSNRLGERLPVDQDDPIDPAREDRWGEMLRQDGPGIDLLLERELEKREDGRTFSQEGLEDITEAMRLWVMTRIQRKLDYTGELPQKLRVRVDVEIDDEREEGSIVGSLNLDPDGDRRVDASS